MVTEVVKALSAEEITELCLRHTLFDWSAQAGLKPLAVASAKEPYFHTVDGRRFIDFNSQLMRVNAGHDGQRIIDAIKPTTKRNIQPRCGRGSCPSPQRPVLDVVGRANG